MITETTNYATYKELAGDLVDKLKESMTYEPNAEELHQQYYNMDYFIIGYYDAEQWLSKYPGIFNAIEVIKEYEQDNFGEVNTDFSSSERVANMFVYIIGEELLYNLDSYDQDAGILNDEQLQAMIDELVDKYTLKEEVG